MAPNASDAVQTSQTLASIAHFLITVSPPLQAYLSVAAFAATLHGYQE
jgi:hypothetical protein